MTVYDAETGSIAPIWNDRAGADPRSNPGAIWQEGQIKFYANPGRYNIVASNGSDSKTWNDVIIVDPDAGGGGGGADYPQLTETTTARTLSLADAGRFLYCTNVAGCAITVPPQSSVAWAANTTILGVGKLGNTTFVEGGGVSIIRPSDRELECYDGAPWALRRTAENEWLLTGYLVEIT